MAIAGEREIFPMVCAAGILRRRDSVTHGTSSAGESASRTNLQATVYSKIRNTIVFGCLAIMSATMCGCTTVRQSTAARTATEQLLLSTAAQSATEDRVFAWLAGKKVFVEDKYFESYDKGNAISQIRERISASGGLLVKTDDKADTIVEIRSPVLSMDNATTLVGVPAMTIPVPLAGPVQTPEIAFYKNERSDSLAEFALFAYQRESGKYIESADRMLGRARLHLYKILFISWKRTDVPELKKQKIPKD